MTDAEIGRFRTIESIFTKALDHAAGPDRDTWLREACGGDVDLYEDAAAFLREHEALNVLHPPDIEPMPRFGAWQAVRLLGRGGMGIVYLADRADGAFKMSAAVKVVPLALASGEIEERFRRERQFLASLDHPKIARLIDGGMSEHGIPYLVMEFVDGLPIDRFCKEHGLGRRDCVALARQLMEALIYIHGGQVVHRDLKPSNVLVDQAGQLKLLDFGTARLADAGGGDAITKSGVFALTPEYASPEQIAGEPATFASDLYSAGLLLEKILPRGEGGPDPQLKLILGKALQAKREDRYRSAAEMDLDLDCYLAARPVRVARTNRRRWLIPVMALCVAICAGMGVELFRYFRASPKSPSIAVLPFTNLTGDPANQYFSDGLTDEIAESLTHLKMLRVIGRAPALQAKKKAGDIREAGRLLNVESVLEGSVARSGDRVRIVATLKRVPDGSLLWSNTYERSASELFAVEADLARGIALSLNIAAGSPASTYIPNPAAHDLAMMGLFDLQNLTTESLVRAESEYQRAIDLDPEYAAAYCGLAWAKYDQFLARGSTYQTEAERQSVEQLFRKALKLDPSLPLAHALPATLAMQFDWDWNRADREFRLAAAGTPNAATESFYAFFLVCRGRFAEADQHLRRMLDLEPFLTASLTNLSVARNLEGRFAEARAIAQQLATQYPAQIAPHQLIGVTYVEEGHPELALPVFQQLAKRFPPAQLYEAMADAKAGRRDEALRLLRPYEDKYPNPGVPMQWFALAYAFMGDEPNTVKWLERSADRHEWQALNLAVNPIFAPMRNSPRFRALRKRMGLDW